MITTEVLKILHEAEIKIHRQNEDTIFGGTDIKYIQDDEIELAQITDTFEIRHIEEVWILEFEIGRLMAVAKCSKDLKQVAVATCDLFRMRDLLAVELDTILDALYRLQSARLVAAIKTTTCIEIQIPQEAESSLPDEPWAFMIASPQFELSEYSLKICFEAPGWSVCVENNDSSSIKKEKLTLSEAIEVALAICDELRNG